MLAIPNPGGSFLAGKPRAVFQERVNAFAGQLWLEVGRLDAAQRRTSGDPEITSPMVETADVLLRQRPYRRARKSIAGHIVALAATLVSGIAISNLAQTWAQFTFAGSFVVAMLAALWGFLSE
jgi:hypothetical protein